MTQCVTDEQETFSVDAWLPLAGVSVCTVHVVPASTSTNACPLLSDGLALTPATQCRTVAQETPTAKGRLPAGLGSALAAVHALPFQVTATGTRDELFLKKSPTATQYAADRQDTLSSS